MAQMIPISKAKQQLLETLDILETDPDILVKLKKAEREIAAGHYTLWGKEKRLKGRRRGRSG